MRILALAAIISVLAAGSVAYAQDIEASGEEFRNSCASCHGEDGKGEGFLAKLFPEINPPDLTQLSNNNDGRYPFNRVLETIDGREVVAAHGDRNMPVWGDRYHFDTREVYGPYGNELVIRARVLELVYYIQSIQAE